MPFEFLRPMGHITKQNSKISEAKFWTWHPCAKGWSTNTVIFLKEIFRGKFDYFSCSGSLNFFFFIFLGLICTFETKIYQSFLLSLIHVMVEKVLFLGKIFQMEILMKLHVMRVPESENHIFSIWSVCMCMCLCACVCVSVISITQKQSTAELSNLVFNICII